MALPPKHSISALEFLLVRHFIMLDRWQKKVPHGSILDSHPSGVIIEDWESVR